MSLAPGNDRQLMRTGMEMGRERDARLVAEADRRRERRASRGRPGARMLTRVRELLRTEQRPADGG